jgi:hypothetical protein
MDTEMFRSSRSHWPGPSAVLLEEFEERSEEFDELDEREDSEEWEDPFDE